jgi:hypothetical protein
MLGLVVLTLLVVGLLLLMQAFLVFLPISCPYSFSIRPFFWKQLASIDASSFGMGRNLEWAIIWLKLCKVCRSKKKGGLGMIDIRKQKISLP